MWEAREAAQRKDFYPRPPRGGRPQSRPACDNISLYFYPRPPRGGRPLPNVRVAALVKFLSTPSARRATSISGEKLLYKEISIHALREEGDDLPPDVAAHVDKFLSTPSARRATGLPKSPTTPTRISIHALREEGDQSISATRTRRKGFLSTPSARRATALADQQTTPKKDFYPRPPRGGRPKPPSM